MKLFSTMIMATLVSVQAFAANPPAKNVAGILARSATLKGIQHGVAKDYNLPYCHAFKVEAYDAKEGKVAADSYCTYTDSAGESTGIWIQVEGVFWDNDTFILEKASFTLAG